MKYGMILFGIVLGLVCSEVVLRSFPTLISLEVLEKFEPKLRSDIAKKLQLPVETEAIRITSGERSDSGRDILLPGANSATKSFADDNDRALGAVEFTIVDQNGFCNSSQNAKRNDHAILIAGDSFTFCTGVDLSDTAASQLEIITGFSTYNLGVRGIGPREYVELLRRYGKNRSPRIIIMNLYEGNDLRDLRREREFLSRPKNTKNEHKRHNGIKSYSIEFLIANFQLIRSNLLSLNKQFDFHYSAPVNGQMMEMNTTNRDQDEIRTALLLKKGDISLDLFKEPIDKFVELAKEIGAIPIILYTPSMYTAFDNKVLFSDPNIGVVLREFSSTQRGWLKNYTDGKGYHYLDLTTAFQREADKGKLTHFPANVHLTPFGHLIVANELGATIKSLNFNNR